MSKMTLFSLQCVAACLVFIYTGQVDTTSVGALKLRLYMKADASPSVDLVAGSLYQKKGDSSNSKWMLVKLRHASDNESEPEFELVKGSKNENHGGWEYQLIEKGSRNTLTIERAKLDNTFLKLQDDPVPEFAYYKWVGANDPYAKDYVGQIVKSSDYLASNEADKASHLEIGSIWEVNAHAAHDNALMRRIEDGVFIAHHLTILQNETGKYWTKLTGEDAEKASVKSNEQKSKEREAESRNRAQNSNRRQRRAAQRDASRPATQKEDVGAELPALVSQSQPVQVPHVSIQSSAGVPSSKVEAASVHKLAPGAKPAQAQVKSEHPPNVKPPTVPEKAVKPATNAATQVPKLVQANARGNGASVKSMLCIFDKNAPGCPPQE